VGPLSEVGEGTRFLAVGGYRVWSGGALPPRSGGALPRWSGERCGFGARARGGRLGDHADEADREAVLGLDLVLRAAVLAANVGAPWILAEVENLSRAEELRAAQALDGGIADQLGHLGHGCSSSRVSVPRARAQVTRRAGHAESRTGLIVEATREAVQSAAAVRPGA